MKNNLQSGRTEGSQYLVSVKSQSIMDAEAQSEWGFNEFSLIESAGRSCAQVFLENFHEFFTEGRSVLSGSCDQYKKGPRVAAAIGAGNNGADAMVMLRYWILAGFLDPLSSALVVSRVPKSNEKGPWVELLKSLKKIMVPVLVWDGDIGETAGRASDDILAQADIIIDGIAGTGIRGAIHGTALEMLKAVNFHRNKVPDHKTFRIERQYTQPFVVSVDLPSGCSDEWTPEMPIIEADVTLAIVPRKYCIYSPAARPHAGIILPAGGVFPEKIISRYAAAEVLDWNSINGRISRIRPTAYKNQRGTVEIRAGSPGATGAAFIAARGAQAAGAGLVRLVTDNEIYPILASRSTGIMIAPSGSNASGEIDNGEDQTGFDNRFKPDAILLGPGWGKSGNRAPVLKKALQMGREGTPLILDADSIELVKGEIFAGNVILTPHPGEFSSFSGIRKEELLYHTIPLLLEQACKCGAVILFKSHVITIASPDGRAGVVDGMTPALATGGSGDLLAGFCAAIAARMVSEGRGVDAYTCAAAAAALLIASARSEGFKTRFTDPLELAGKAADLAGNAWLSLGNSIKGIFS